MAAITAPPIPTTPQILRTSTSTTLNRPVLIAPTPDLGLSASSFTHKEWVIPPRPKPGRKPAGDAPPTKRKAQNREAQRAFRERRAAKVGELEEQLKGLEEECQKDNEKLRSRIEQLQQDLEQCTDLISSWQRRCEELEAACRREAHLRQQSEIEVKALRSSLTTQTQAFALPARQAKKNQNGSEQAVQLQEQGTPVNEIFCGRCNNSSRCPCIEEAFEMAGIAMEGSAGLTSKRPHSPAADMDSKRICQNGDGQGHDSDEIDFTAQFSRRRSENQGSTSFAPASLPAPSDLDKCGFCNDTSECICAALAAQTERQPSISIQAPDATTASTSCNNNPGTCAQCRSDPSSTLFCKTLAATRSMPTSQDSMSGAKNSKAIQTAPNTSSAAIVGPTLSCADAFSTLSRHHAFPQASTELGTWVSQLTAVPGLARTEGKTAFEIEAASVMSVLKFFDNRFGRAPQAPTINGSIEGQSANSEDDRLQQVSNNDERSRKDTRSEGSSL